MEWEDWFAFLLVVLLGATAVLTLILGLTVVGLVFLASLTFLSPWFFVAFWKGCVQGFRQERNG